MLGDTKPTAATIFQNTKLLIGTTFYVKHNSNSEELEITNF